MADQTGVITYAGQALLNKLIATGDGLTITRWALGDGAPPSDPYTVTAIAHEVLSGTEFARRSTSIGGTAVITVQVISSTLTEAITATELGIYARDPETGAEVLLPYVMLDAQVIAPSSTSVGAVYTWDVTIAVGPIETVNITLDPAAFVSRSEFEEGILGAQANLTLQAANWTGTDAPYSYTVALPGLNAQSPGSMGLAGAATTQQADAYDQARIGHHSQTDGSVTFIARGAKPEVDIPVIINYWGVQHGDTSGE